MSKGHVHTRASLNSVTVNQICLTPLQRIVCGKKHQKKSLSCGLWCTCDDKAWKLAVTHKGLFALLTVPAQDTRVHIFVRPEEAQWAQLHNHCTVIDFCGTLFYSYSQKVVSWNGNKCLLMAVKRRAAVVIVTIKDIMCLCLAPSGWRLHILRWVMTQQFLHSGGKKKETQREHLGKYLIVSFILWSCGLWSYLRSHAGKIVWWSAWEMTAGQLPKCTMTCKKVIWWRRGHASRIIAVAACLTNATNAHGLY